MILMPLITKAFAAGSTYVIDYKSLRLTVLNGDKVICIGGGLSVNDSRKYAEEILNSIKIR